MGEWCVVVWGGGMAKVLVCIPMSQYGEQALLIQIWFENFYNDMGLWNLMVIFTTPPWKKKNTSSTFDVSHFHYLLYY